VFKWLKEIHEIFDLFFSGSYVESTAHKPVKMEVKKNRVVELDEKMPEAQLNLVVELKSREILETSRGTARESVETLALHSILDDAKMYQTKSQIKRIHSILNYVGSGKSVLDCAGGSGHIASLLKQAGNDVTVLDHSEIQLLRAKWTRKLKTVLGGVDRIPSPDNVFDVVLVGDVLGQCKNISSVLLEAERVCKNDGQIIITTPLGFKNSGTLRSIQYTSIDDENLIISIKNTPHV
jgi:2-polyprenyl-3-methyl-5-hydroxy-6-metoxy-1,4-benzoquinol methylase